MYYKPIDMIDLHLSHERQALRQAHCPLVFRPCCPPPARDSKHVTPHDHHHHPTHTYRSQSNLASTMFRMKFILLMAVALLATVVVHAQEIDAGKSGNEGGWREGLDLLDSCPVCPVRD